MWRRKVWWAFTLDTFEHTSPRATRLAKQLRDLLQGEVAIDVAHNTWELGLWEALLDERKARNKGRGTQKWWDGVVKEVPELMESPQYGSPDLPDLRAALQANIDHEVDDPESVTNQFRALVDDD